MREKVVFLFQKKNVKEEKISQVINAMVSLSPYQRYHKTQPILEAQRKLDEKKRKAELAEEMEREKKASETRIERVRNPFQSINIQIQSVSAFKSLIEELLDLPTCG